MIQHLLTKMTTMPSMPTHAASTANNAFALSFTMIHILSIVLPLMLWVLSKVAALSPPPLPDSPEAMVRQAATAMQSAFQRDGLNRQTIRLALSQAMYSSKEEESFVADRAVGWQGGPQEVRRTLGPLTQQLLRAVSTRDDTSGLTAKIREQGLLEFDGSALVSAESPMGPKQDSLALLQPNTDRYYIDLIQQMEQEFSDSLGKDKRLFCLVNPAWKAADSFGFFFAAQAQKQILDRYPVTYALDQFIVKGNKVSLLKCWPYDWCAYANALGQGEQKAVRIFLGSFATRPDYEAVRAKLDGD